MSVLLDDSQTDVAKTVDGKYVMIDTCHTSDYGWETMVFECDRDGNGKSWTDLDSVMYVSKERASTGHTEMINKWMNHRY